MKAGWEVKALGEVCRLINGRAYKQAELLDEGKYRVLRVGNFFTSNHWYFSDLEMEPDKYCEDGDLLYAWSASFGPRIWRGEKTVYHYHIWKVASDPAFVIRDYLYYFFDWDKEKIKADQGAGTTMVHVSKKSMDAREIPLPPLDEQKRIVEVLDAAFEGLSRARAHTETNLQNARELFESGLLEVFGGLNEPNDQKLLRDVSIEFGRGKSKHRPRNDKALYEGEYPFIQTGDVRNSRHIIESYSQTYNEFGLAQSKLWPAGTVCITIAANIAETGVLGFDACFPDSIIGMVPDASKTNSTYVEYLLQFFQKRLKALGEGSAQQNINLATFETEYFPFPPLPIQEDAIARLSHLRSTVEDLESHYRAKLADLDALRQALLQKAFAGELS